MEPHTTWRLCGKAAFDPICGGCGLLGPGTVLRSAVDGFLELDPRGMGEHLTEEANVGRHRRSRSQSQVLRVIAGTRAGIRRISTGAKRRHAFLVTGKTICERLRRTH